MIFMKINELRPLEHNFTEVLKKLVLIPEILYYYGKIPEKRDGLRCVAIVGSRKNTSYGKELAYNAAYEAAKAGAIVISGLAYGIDSIAHRGALDAGGITIAVLGTPITEIYPHCHTSLAKEIVGTGGAVISEYGPADIAAGKKELQARFLRRNRLIAGLSDIVFIPEAADRSGSLNTACHALDIGIDLMAAPGDITRLNSRGCNRLLAQGAIPYTAVDDLLDLLFPARISKNRVKKTNELDRDEIIDTGETEVEKKILTEILDGVFDGEEIVRKTQISSSDFFQGITILEIKGLVKPLGANQWVLGLN